MHEVSKSKCFFIKSLIEKATGYDDIGNGSRKRPYPELRMMFSKLCRDFSGAPYEVIGDILGGYDYSTIIRHKRVFDDLLSVNGVDYVHVYEDIKKQLIELKEMDIHDHEQVSLITLRRHYRNRFFEMSDKYRNVINYQTEIIRELKNKLASNDKK